MTLAFLGWQDEAAAGAIAEAAMAAAAGLSRPRLTPGEPRAVPDRRPRLFALDLVDEAGAPRRSRPPRPTRSSRAASTGLNDGPGGRTSPIARVKRGARRVEPLAADPPPLGPIEPGELTLYRSTLRPQGALYEPLARVALGD